MTAASERELVTIILMRNSYRKMSAEGWKTCNGDFIEEKAGKPLPPPDCPGRTRNTRKWFMNNSGLVTQRRAEPWQGCCVALYKP